MLCTLFLTLFYACKDDDMSDDGEVANVYEKCCETPAIDVSIGQGNVYIPNIFTPNGDGINDAFLIHADQNIEQIESFLVTSQDGSTVFERLNVMPNEFASSWLPSESEAPNGVYSYVARIKSTDDVTETLNSTVCVYRCKTETDSILLQNIPNCHFSTQNNGQGELDPLAPSLEDPECF